MTLIGRSRGDFFGHAIELADLDGDGNQDLIVATPFVDALQPQAGGVYVYRGLPSGLFEESPSNVFLGRASGDRLGTALTSCDYNGDGYLDLAIGAPNAEDPTLEEPRNNQGAVHIYLSHEGRFLDIPSQILYGEMEGASFGSQLVSGDLNGDEYCDLAVRTAGEGCCFSGSAVRGKWKQSDETACSYYSRGRKCNVW